MQAFHVFRDCPAYKRAILVSMWMAKHFGQQSDRPYDLVHEHTLQLVDKAIVLLAVIHPNTCRGSFLAGEQRANDACLDCISHYRVAAKQPADGWRCHLIHPL